MISTAGDATHANDGWTAPAGGVFDFIIGIYRKESTQWLQWAGTSAQTWLVKEAAQIRLE